MIYLIYKHTSPSGKSYIGLTSKTMEKRFEEHCKFKNAKTKFQKSIKKYGPQNFVSEILICDIETLLEAKEIERFYVKWFDSYKNGYNGTPGGDGMKHLTDEIRNSMSFKKKGISGENHPMFKFKHTEETKLKISLAKKGKKLTLEHKQKISDNSAKLSGENHPMFGKTGDLHYNFGKTISEEQKYKISQTIKNNGSSRGENNPMFGKTHKKDICIYCLKIMSHCMISRWHNENCKFKGCFYV